MEYIKHYETKEEKKINQYKKEERTQTIERLKLYATLKKKKTSLNVEEYAETAWQLSDW